MKPPPPPRRSKSYERPSSNNNNNHSTLNNNNNNNSPDIQSNYEEYDLNNMMEPNTKTAGGVKNGKKVSFKEQGSPGNLRKMPSSPSLTGGRNSIKYFRVKLKYF